MKILQKKHVKLSELAKNMDFTMQALEKHTKNLIKSGLIEKTNGKFQLTDIGKSITYHVDAIEFFEHNRRLLQKYSLNHLPGVFVERIGELQNFQVIEGYVATIEKYKKILSQTKEFAKIIIAQISLDIYKEGMPKFQENNVKVSYILGENSIVPKGWLELSKKMKEPSLISKGILQRRMIKKVPIMMYLSENHAFIALPNKEGMADPSTMLTSSNERFRKWCNDLFEHYWKKSSTFLESKVHET